MGKPIQFKNTSKHSLSIPDLGIEVGPGEICLVPEGYAFPRRSHAGERFPAVIEQLADCPGCEERTKGRNPDGSPNHPQHPMLVPVDEADVERFAAVPEVDARGTKQPKMPTIADLVRAGVPRGVAEQIVKAAHAAATAARTGTLVTGDEEEAPAPAKAAPASKTAKPSEK